MKTTFNFGANDDVKKIIFHDEEKDPCMEIHAQNTQLQKLLFNQLWLCLEANSLGEAPIKLNFSIEDNNNFIKIKGNIYNALDLMKDRELIDKKLISHIEKDDDEDLKDLIEKSKKFEIPASHQIQDSGTSPDNDSATENSQYQPK